jgi:hypothetical protein
MPTKGLMNALDVVQHIFVGEAKGLDPQALHERIPFPVVRLCLCRQVAVSVDFDHQVQRRAVKVGNVMANTVLPAKFHAHLPIAQQTPHKSFRLGHVFAQILAALFVHRRVEDGVHDGAGGEMGTAIVAV